MTHIDYRAIDEMEMAEQYKLEHGEYPAYPQPDNKPVIHPKSPWQLLTENNTEGRLPERYDTDILGRMETRTNWQ